LAFGERVAETATRVTPTPRSDRVAEVVELYEHSTAQEHRATACSGAGRGDGNVRARPGPEVDVKELRVEG
jgi:hypothetical protein